MSKLKTNTLETVDGLSSVNVADLANTVTEILGIDKKQLATAWGLMGSDGVMSGRFKLSSAKTATGKYTVTFATPMDNDEYVVSLESTATATVTPKGKLHMNRTVNGFTLETGSNTQFTALQDNEVSIIIFGGKN